MKTKKLSKKLSLSKKTVSNLNDSEMNVVYGGIDTFVNTICRTRCVSECFTCITCIMSCICE